MEAEAERPSVVLSDPASLEDRDLLHAAFVAEQQAEEAEQAARLTLRRKYRRARTILDEPVGTTAAQVRTAVVQHRVILGELIEILKESGLLLDDQ